VTEGGTLDSFTTSLSFATGLSIIGIVVAVNGGRIAAHRALKTRFFSVQGAAAVALGLALLALGLAAIAVGWIRGLGLLG
jgi:hypothetical protein